ncbi:MAG: immunoglobulin-like domain-containing protein, partial [Minisyncoccota bacterium]
MQNKTIFKNISGIILRGIFLAMLVFSAQMVYADNSVTDGTIDVCVAIKNTTTQMFATTSPFPIGDFSITISSTTNFTNSAINPSFSFSNFSQNSTIVDGTPVYCTPSVKVPFGNYYYNEAITSTNSSVTWNQSKYFDTGLPNTITEALPYNNALFTLDTSDDVTLNIVSDGYVPVSEDRPNRTIVVFASYTPVVEESHAFSALSDTQCIIGQNLISNGGFEYPVVNNPNLWMSIPLNTPNFFWTSLDTITYPYVELQAGYTEGSATWMPHSGIQYAEIDGGTSHDVSQVINTIVGKRYNLSYWVSPRPDQPIENNVINIFTNGDLIDTYTNIGSITTAWTKRQVSFIATSTQTRVSFIQGQNSVKEVGVFLDDVSLTCAGDQIVPVVNQCVLPETLGDSTSEIIGDSYGPWEKVVQTMLVDNGFNIDDVLDQKEYQSWNLKQGTTTIEVQYLDGEKAGSEIFGYYLNNDISTFTPVFASGPGSTTQYPELPEAKNGDKFSITVKGDSIQFALYGIYGGDHYTSTVNTVNENGADRVLAYDVPNSIKGGEYLLAFEDLKITASDNDYNDELIKITFEECEKVNTPPTINLLGANPITIDTGTNFTEPGATAQDLEDGNITANIIITGTVATT